MKRHKHYDLILAWANGAEIQNEYNNGIWLDEDFPYWYPDNNYRIKPTPKPDVVRYGYISSPNMKIINLTFCVYELDNIKFTFDGETGKLKSAEVI
jgi:hypothetical protein